MTLSDVLECFEWVSTRKVDRIVTRDEQQSFPLEHEHQYQIFCFAEDDWPIQEPGMPKALLR